MLSPGTHCVLQARVREGVSLNMSYVISFIIKSLTVKRKKAVRISPISTISCRDSSLSTIVVMGVEAVVVVVLNRGLRRLATRNGPRRSGTSGEVGFTVVEVTVDKKTSIIVRHVSHVIGLV